MRALKLPRSLPLPADFDALLAKYKAFRLLALQLSPKSFGSTHAREAAFTDDVWVSRMSNPLAATIVGVDDTTTTTTTTTTTSDAASSNDEVELLLQSEWLGTTTLTGPYEYDAAVKVLAGHKEVEVDQVLLSDAKIFFINGMSVIPAARGAGVGSAILAQAMRVARELAAGQKARVVLIVDYENVAARRTYEKGGFTLVTSYWWDDYRETPTAKTEAAVMVWDVEAK
jgi:ribosomal protein S18 acetylase RimI-like enzyme